MKPSKFHNNRKWHNWLIYNINDNFLEKYSKFYKGILVDLGCGEAPYKEYFLQHAEKYLGVDWDNSLHHTKADIASNLNEKIDLPDEYADTLVALSVIEHLCEPQIFLNECYRVLKPGGHLILQAPFQWWLHESPYDYFRYTPYGFIYMLKKAGFSDIIIEPQTGFFTMWLMKLNYFSLKFIRGPKPLRLIIYSVLWIIWNFNQIVAPLLDKLDRNWVLETAGYFVVATKL